MNRAGTFLLGAIIPILMFGCEKEPDSDQKYVNTGKAASQKLMQSLKGALMTAIADSGIEGAINVCSQQALTLTTQIDAQSDSITDIRRVSDKFRNPHNAPDETDLEAFAYFREYQTKNDSLPAYYIIKSEGDLRFYQPLVVQPLCLNCHGQIDKMEANVVAAINRIYPEDKAVGYNLGDFRGAIRVTMLK